MVMSPNDVIVYFLVMFLVMLQWFRRIFSCNINLIKRYTCVRDEYKVIVIVYTRRWPSNEWLLDFTVQLYIVRYCNSANIQYEFSKLLLAKWLYF